LLEEKGESSIQRLVVAGFRYEKAPADCPCGLLKLWQLKRDFLGAQVSYN